MKHTIRFMVLDVHLTCGKCSHKWTDTTRAAFSDDMPSDTRVACPKCGELLDVENLPPYNTKITELEEITP